jgi:hypothetical protein
MTVRYAYIGNLVKSKDEAGHVVVKGIASDDTLDLDNQRVDPDWLNSALPEWFNIGNIREMHTMKAIGKGIELEQLGKAWNLTAKVIDKDAAALVEEGVLTGFSIGIKGARIDKSEKALSLAPEGVIKGGTIVEVSLVDRPANPSCSVSLAKAAGLEEAEGAKGDETPIECPNCVGTGRVMVAGENGVMLEEDCQDCDGEGTIKTVEPDTEKKAYSDRQRSNMADKGEALPDGSFPIRTVGDLKNAVQSFGRAKDKAKVKAHIKARAEALGKQDVLPDKWKAAEPDTMEHDPDDLAAVRQSLINLIVAELDEMANGEDNEICDVRELLTALDLFITWWEGEAEENETTEPFTQEDDDDMNIPAQWLGIEPDLVKAATDQPANFVDQVKKSLGIDDIATYKTLVDEQAEEIKSLKATLDTVVKMAAPGGPALRATNDQQLHSAEADELELKAAKFEQIGKTAGDPDTRNQYLSAAADLRKRASTIRK